MVTIRVTHLSTGSLRMRMSLIRGLKHFTRGGTCSRIAINAWSYLIKFKIQLSQQLYRSLSYLYLDTDKYTLYSVVALVMVKDFVIDQSYQLCTSTSTTIE